MNQARISTETWEQVKIAYAAGASLRELARKMSIPEGTVLAHAKRKGWTQQIEAARQEAKSTQSNAITPIQALATTLNERKDKSRLHLSKYVAEASEEAANANNKLKIAGNVRDVSNVMEKLWPDQAKAESKLTLNLLSQNTALSISTRETPTVPESSLALLQSVAIKDRLSWPLGGRECPCIDEYLTNR